MHLIKLNNGVEIPQLGLGVFKTPDGDETYNAVTWALEAGYRHVDTARIYRNEPSVGRAIADSPVPRDEVFVTTKVWNDDIRARRAAAAYQESLERLGMDHVDLLLTHWPVDGVYEAYGELEKLYEAGKVRSIGVSNMKPHHLETLMQTAHITPAVNQIESNPYFTNQASIDYCLERGIQVETWAPLGGTGGNLLEDETLNALAKKYGKSPAQVVIRWDIQRGLICIPKSTHKDRIAQNLDVWDFELSAADMDAISALNRDAFTADPDTITF